ncbi:MAG: SDR family NAD(P)-dependent oxidoreductase [Phycisphaerae bacterium]
MSDNISQKVVLITGASSGIGAACALALARRGAALVLGARRMDKLQAVAEQARTFGAQVVIESCNVAVRDDVVKLVQAAKNKLGRLDVAIANAGFGLEVPVHLTTEAQMEEIWRINVMGTWYVMATAAPLMIAQKSGHIIAISSAIARRSIPQMGAYAMTKAAQLSLAEAQRIELSDHGVYVSTVHPTTTDTEFFQQATRRSGKRVDGHGKTQSAELVAEKIVRLIAHRQPELWPCAPVRYAMAVAAAFPALVDRVIKKQFSAANQVHK